MKQEIRIFFTALMFYTRIPCPAWVDHSQENLTKATRYFPLVGIIVGGICGGIWYGAQFLFPRVVAIMLSMIAGVFVTGAFHEDGLADVCDGFGGGWTKQKILDIMKDSRVGAYGVIGLVLLFLFKYSLLISLNPAVIPVVLISAHALSRFVTITFLYTHTYARPDTEGQEDASKIRPIAQKPALKELIIAGFFGITPLLLLHSPWVFLLIIPLFIIKGLLGRYFVKWIGGYTGDCLGATQQVTEILFYLCFIALWKYI
ncbi:MAG TPA: adenosylcobinamide-GDP ribazoletransferase [Bacteroidia bacterium]|jgi:adenosylcobinamide-GDP ribazoletransferase|nr:adenosylcobinamide-GDP ribazoletransferase [Bacteroidia bacterium]